MLPAERATQVEELFRQYGRGVGSYIMARVGNADVAETITSNVFMIVVRRIEQCRSSPAAWLWSIVRSELARHFRQHRPTVELDERLCDPALSPPEVAARNEMQERMRIAIHKLGEEQQRIIYLKFFLDVPNTEIAAELRLSASNVGVIIHRAMKQLRELMEEPALQRHSERNPLKARAVLSGPGEPGGPPPGAARDRAGSAGKMGSFVVLLVWGIWSYLQ
ncbi:MAG TPA: sigma-70 family RNA polymerase sigma factor [Tepidisphaeraceae bacterium]|nr:sigma-70 family RNA polymerase sigma factor [Tepidisphaeraceae bacterium]